MSLALATALLVLILVMTFLLGAFTGWWLTSESRQRRFWAELDDLLEQHAHEP